MEKSIGFIFCFVIYFSAYGQKQEHNFKVGPNETDCDFLDITDLSVTKSISRIRASKFRFDQSFKITGKQGLQSGVYYSCDNKEGFLIIEINNKKHLFDKVDIQIWKELISSSNPEEYYFNIKNQLIEYQ